jgi:Ca-activated chloride channel homolog
VTFLSAERLWLLPLVAGLAIAYVLMQRRRRAYAVRFSTLPLLERVAGKGPGWRRHVPAVAFLFMLLFLVTGFARPEAEIKVPREEASVIVALDVSVSMRAQDVDPDRITVARNAADQFVDLLPKRFNVGLVTFSREVTVAATPSTDRVAVHEALSRLRLQGGTAIGDAVEAAVNVLRPPPADLSGNSNGLATPPGPDTPPPSDGPPARIVLLSDGDNTTGQPIEAGIEAAKAAGVPVSTIAYGTPEGTVEMEGRTLRVPVDKEALRNLAESTGGKAYEAATAEELEEVYADLGSSIGFRIERREITAWFIGAGLLAAGAAAVASLLWFSRLP